MSHGPHRRFLRYAACAIALLSTLAASTPRVDAHVLHAGVWDPTNGCIHDNTSLPAVPSVAGDQFVVRSPSAASSVASQIANAIRAHDVMGEYERGLGISSLLQPGQPGPFPIFVDPAFAPYANGITAPLCEHPTWEGVIDDGTGADIDGTAYHELFHAAQNALLGRLDVADNWWWEATAEAAEVWFGGVPGGGDPYCVDQVVHNPSVPMDSYNHPICHQYGAYIFVQWVLRSTSLPGPAGWQFLHASILGVGADPANPDPAISQALSLVSPSPCLSTKLACEVASFWADETNTTDPAPSFGHPPAKMQHELVESGTLSGAITPAVQYGAKLVALDPGSVKQMQVVVSKLPAGVELWVNEGKGSLQRVLPGEDYNQTFCLSGHNPGTVDLSPSSGYVALALTTDSTAPAQVKYKVHASTTACQSQFTIVPGIEIGGLHLGMSFQQASKAACVRQATQPVNDPHFGGVVQEAQFVEGITPPFPTPDVCTADLYDESSAGFNANVNTYFFNAHLVWMQINISQRFITTTGIDTWEAIPATQIASCLANHPNNGYECHLAIPGSTGRQFGSASGATCTEDPPSPPPNPHPTGEQCAAQGPPGRFTVANALYWVCPDVTADIDGHEFGFCDMPVGMVECQVDQSGMSTCDMSSDYYVQALGVATKKGYQLFK